MAYFDQSLSLFVQLVLLCLLVQFAQVVHALKRLSSKLVLCLLIHVFIVVLAGHILMEVYRQVFLAVILVDELHFRGHLDLEQIILG